MCLFHFSTCFEQPSAHHQENQLYQYIVWYISLCVCVWPSGMQVKDFLSDLHTRRPHTHRVVYTRQCIDTIDSPVDEHWVARNMKRSEINTLKKCVMLVFNTNCTEMHGQQNIKPSVNFYHNKQRHILEGINFQNNCISNINLTIVKRCEAGPLEYIMTLNNSVFVRIPVLYNSSGRFLHAEPTSKFDCSAVGSCDPCAGQGRTAQHYQVPKKSGPNLLVT